MNKKIPFNSLVRRRSTSGLGLFTTKLIKKNAFVIEYTGEKISSVIADLRGGKYLFAVNDSWTIDGKGRENLSRYINHSCKPNCEVRIKKGRIFIFSNRTIEPGEELHYDYGKEYFEKFIKPKGCVCWHCTQKDKPFK